MAKTGLPGEHHFYIAFNTEAPGVVISKRLKQKYPEEMTVVLQHRFWDLTVTEERFEVKLTFDGIPERLSVPFTAVKVFFDPSVPYGLQFEESEATMAPRRMARSSQPAEGADAEAPVQPALRRREEAARRAQAALGQARRRSGRETSIQGADQAACGQRRQRAAASEAKVVSLDKFRKK